MDIVAPYGALTTQLRKSSRTASHISFQNNNLQTTSVRRESLPLSAHHPVL